MCNSEFSKWKFELVDFMDDLVRVFDKNGFIVYINESMKKYIGNDVGKFCNFFNSKSCNNDNKYKVFSSLKCLSPIGENTDVVTDVLTIDGHDFFVKSSPIFDDSGNYFGSIEVFRDVTEENKLQKKIIDYNKKTKKDMQVASDIQKSILEKLNYTDGLKIEYKYISCDELSGDFFDVIEFSDDRVCFYMADVMGHGISSSLITMFIKFAVRTITRARNIKYPKEILTELAKEFSKLDLQMYFTIFLGIYNKKTNEFEYSNAGHNCVPILFNKTDKNLRLNLSGLPISWLSWSFRKKGYSFGKVKLSKGDALVFYTDGITETKNKDRENFGEERLLSVIDKYKLKLSDVELLDKIIEETSNFRSGVQEDDIALLIVRIE